MNNNQDLSAEVVVDDEIKNEDMKRRKRDISSSSSSTDKKTNASKRRKKDLKQSESSAALQRITEVQVDEMIEKGSDFSKLILKPDHAVRPIWVTPKMHIFLETFSPIYQQAYDFLVAIAEPLSRPENIHEYILTEYSLYAAVSIGLETDQIIKVLEKLSKVHLSTDTKEFIKRCTMNYGKVKLVIQQNKFHVESPDRNVIVMFLEHPEIAAVAIPPQPGAIPKATIDKETGRFYVIKKDIKDAEIQKFQLQSMSNKNINTSTGAVSENNEQLIELAKAVQELNENAEDEEDDFDLSSSSKRLLYSFEINSERVEHVLNVKSFCSKIGYPMLEEYDFKNDTMNENLIIDLKPATTIRPYQEKSLSKMFSSGCARSGIIVLPCGAGKTLVGITSSCTVKKSTLVLCINEISVWQWKDQFLKWTTISEDQIVIFTSKHKMTIPSSGASVLITTYSMITHTGKRSVEGKRVMDQIREREWGLMILDEVHAAPADSFRKVISVVKAHCKLGLTATLLREDQKIGDLYHLVGSKLYEANWLDLQKNGFLADVECVEVWCPMTQEFYNRYLDENINYSKKKLLYLMNPNKLRACEFLIRYHEENFDKIIVFSDNVYTLKSYAIKMNKPFVYGDTPHQNRTEILNRFKSSPNCNTVFLSKIGDTAIDIPEATVIIQISSHFGSRRQEAQRLGRILRPKDSGVRNQKAYFYTLLSQDTHEMRYSSKRQKFLVDQGYSFKVFNDITSHIKKKSNELKLMKTKADELQLLETLMAQDDNAATTENIEDLNIETRKNASTKDKSGGKGIVYTETRSKTHPLFRSRNRVRQTKL